MSSPERRRRILSSISIISLSHLGTSRLEASTGFHLIEACLSPINLLVEVSGCSSSGRVCNPSSSRLRVITLSSSFIRHHQGVYVIQVPLVSE
jgi:hypothetical protein